MKTCFKCKSRLPLTEFYKHGQMADGHLNKCKSCTKKDVAEYSSENREKVLAYDRARAKTQKRKNKTAAHTKKYPNARRAVLVIYRMVKRGEINREPCELCRAKNVVAHHDDYDKPKEVRWLCRTHHREWHIENGPGRNRE